LKNDSAEFVLQTFTRENELPHKLQRSSSHKQSEQQVCNMVDIAFHNGYSCAKNPTYTEDRGMKFTIGNLLVIGVADGHGRTPYYAKYVTVNFQFEFILALKNSPNNIQQALFDTFATLTKKIDILYQENKLYGGTTFSVCVIDQCMTPQKAYIAHLGDSPIFILRNSGSGYEIKFRTIDHDIHNPIEQERLFKANPLIYFDGDYMCLSNNKIMTVRGFGDYYYNDPNLYPNCIIKETGELIGRIPDISVIDLQPSDLIIASSDGLLETITKNGIGPGRNEQEICEDAWDGFINQVKSISKYLINKKIDRLTTLYMKKLKIDASDIQRKMYQEMLEKNMDNHVVITHLIEQKSIQLSISNPSRKRALSL